MHIDFSKKKEEKKTARAVYPYSKEGKSDILNEHRSSLDYARLAASSPRSSYEQEWQIRERIICFACEGAGGFSNAS